MPENHEHRRSTDNGNSQYSELWAVTREHAAEITDLKESTARIESGMSSVVQIMNTTAADVKEMGVRLSKPPPRTDLNKIIATGCAVFTLFGVLMGAILAPLFNKVSDLDLYQRGIIASRIGEAYDQGVYDQKLDSLIIKVDHLDRLDHTRDEKISNLEQTVAKLFAAFSVR